LTNQNNYNSSIEKPKKKNLDLGSPQVKSIWQHGLDNWAMSTVQRDKMDLAKVVKPTWQNSQ
jgi:hypothetical protein